MRALPILFLLLSTKAFAQTPQAEFPADAVALSASELQDRLSGKVYSLKPAAGDEWRWEFKSGGVFFINIGRFSDSGKWAVQDSKVCSEGSKIKASCNEIRQLGSVLLLKRDSGEVVAMSQK
jgi:hypothetical protein